VDPRVAKLKTHDECETFARNSIERGRLDLAQQAHRRAIELLADSHNPQTQVERECLAAIHAYEAVLSKKHGRKIRAGRTWPMVKALGVVPAVERIVDRPEESVAYAALAEMGLSEYLFEAVILRHPNSFSPTAVERSRRRMATLNGT